VYIVIIIIIYMRTRCGCESARLNLTLPDLQCNNNTITSRNNDISIKPAPETIETFDRYKTTSPAVLYLLL